HHPVELHAGERRALTDRPADVVEIVRRHELGSLEAEPSGRPEVALADATGREDDPPDPVAELDGTIAEAADLGQVIRLGSAADRDPENPCALRPLPGGAGCTPHPVRV